LDKKYFDKQTEPLYGKIVKQIEEECPSNEVEKILPFNTLKKFMIQIGKNANYQALGVDFTICERENSISLFDFNSFPNYSFLKAP
jgi:hypothetical protein